MSRDGIVLWEGESRINGQMIVAIATGISGRQSLNGKTGNMVQTWILARDVAPGPAWRSGEDAGVCGDCVHRGKGDTVRTCYVNLAWGPTGVWKKYTSGDYQRLLTPPGWGTINYRKVRIGTYGDPCAVPARIWEGILPSDRRFSTGYTQRWRDPVNQDYRKFLMASVSSEDEAREAKGLGWRAFLTIPLDVVRVPDGFTWCPSDTLQAAPKVPCEDCGLCNGTRGSSEKPVAIFAHGVAAKSVGKKRQRLPVVERKFIAPDPVTRIDPELKARAKAQARRNGETLKRLVDRAVSRELT